MSHTAHSALLSTLQCFHYLLMEGLMNDLVMRLCPSVAAPYLGQVRCLAGPVTPSVLRQFEVVRSLKWFAERSPPSPLHAGQSRPCRCRRRSKRAGAPPQCRRNNVHWLVWEYIGDKSLQALLEDASRHGPPTDTTESVGEQNELACSRWSVVSARGPCRTPRAARRCRPARGARRETAARRGAQARNAAAGGGGAGDRRLPRR